MGALKVLIQRNLRLFFRDKAAVFFSFLAVIIIIALYVLFLADIQVQNIKAAFPEGASIRDKDIAWLVNSWVMAGIISINTVTITLGSYGTIINDIENGTGKDFLSSPVKRYVVVLGYIISSWVLAIVLSIITLVIFEIYVVLSGGMILAINDFIKTLLVIILSVISFSAVLFYIITFIKSTHTFGVLSGLLGTMIGFLAGIYIPLVALPNYMKTVVSIFPVSYSASLLRRIVTREPLEKVFGYLGHAPANGYSRDWGIILYLGKQEITPTIMVCGLILFGIIFYVLSILRLSKHKLS